MKTQQDKATARPYFIICGSFPDEQIKVRNGEAGEVLFQKSAVEVYQAANSYDALVAVAAAAKECERRMRNAWELAVGVGNIDIAYQLAEAMENASQALANLAKIQGTK